MRHIVTNYIFSNTLKVIRMKGHLTISDSFLYTKAHPYKELPYFADCSIIKDIQIDMTELIARYFEKYPIVPATHHQNWRILF